MGRTKYKQIMVEMESSVLMEDNVDGDAPRVLNHAKYDALDTVLKRPMGRLQAPRAPSSTTDGELFGYMMHQGKYRGAWKTAYFVFKDGYLFQYEKDTSAAPKKSFYVSFCMSEKMAAEAMAEETSAKYMRKLEEKACSLRLNIYSPDKVKVLTAPTEATMSKWVEHLNNAVKTACDAAAPNVYNEKLEAAEQMKPLMLGQAFKEVDQYHTLVNNLISAGLLHGDDDPRHADNIAKSGKMKMLKSGMDENVWQQFYFVLVDKTVYYYKSRKHDKGGKHNYDDKDDDEDEEDDEDKDEMPWKGCFDVTLATVNQAPEAISKKAKVFQIKTPLRTFILKARHEVDAEEWMSHICASQQGVPVEQREIKLRGFDVYKDPLAGKLSRPETLSLLDILKHPVGVRYFGQYLEANADAASAKMVKSFKSIEKYKTKVVPAKKHKKALKIFKKFVQKNDLIEKSLKNELAEQVEHFDFAASNMFMKLENALMDHYAKLFDGFIKSEIFGTLTASTGPKMVVVSHEKSANQNFKIDGTIYVGRSRENEGGDGYIQLDDDHKVSREHLRIDAGPLAVMVTDLGSSKGTKLGSKDGKKIMTKIILPGQAIFIGGYILTYQLGNAPVAKGKKKGGMFSGLFSKKK